MESNNKEITKGRVSNRNYRSTLWSAAAAQLAAHIIFLFRLFVHVSGLALLSHMLQLNSSSPEEEKIVSEGPSQLQTH